MKTLTYNHSTTEKWLDDLTLEFDNFPESTDISPIQYDSAKLIEILRNKEVEEVCKGNQKEYQLYDGIDRQLGKVVKDLVLEKNFEESIKEYYQFERKIEKEISSDLYIFAKQALLSVKSLYYYKTKNWDKAIAITLECIALNDYLVQLGMQTLVLRVYEQNKNISRILFKSGAKQEAHNLLFNLFNYMLNGVNNNLYGTIFLHEKLWKKTPILRETYSYEMFNMVAEDIIRFNIEKTEAFFPNDWYMNLTFEVDNINRQILYNWIYINQKLHEKDYATFFSSLSYFFNEPSSKYYDILKVYLIIDLIKLINQLNYKSKSIIFNNIHDFLVTKININKKLKQKIIDLYLK
ncbi:conserved hypothetical protein [Tenacibaculum sp. 190524A02b]|uniref:Uncharacterized protein n=1 Tax=Tenacibaculum vairaonense TaxID=3137860 RepID=A0ABM9PPX1_9FLAO